MPYQWAIAIRRHHDATAEQVKARYLGRSGRSPSFRGLGRSSGRVPQWKRINGAKDRLRRRRQRREAIQSDKPKRGRRRRSTSAAGPGDWCGGAAPVTRTLERSRIVPLGRFEVADGPRSRPITQFHRVNQPEPSRAPCTHVLSADGTHLPAHPHLDHPDPLHGKSPPPIKIIAPAA